MQEAIESLCDLSATAAIDAMTRGDISAEQYASALLDRADSQRALNAFISLQPDRVLDAARAADLKRAAGGPLGILHGLPIPLKDSVNTVDYATSNGTHALREFHPGEDAALVKALVQHGAIVMGKTNLTELSLGWTSNNATFGPVCNPYDLARIPGGSSGGAAAAVAGGIAPLAVGADTLGSIQVPASFCGIAGLRPTFGRYPNHGAFSLTSGKLDQVGAMARHVEDLALFDTVYTGSASNVRCGSLEGSLIGKRIGVAAFYEDGLDSEVGKVYFEALNRLEEAGVILVRADIPAEMTKAFDIAATIMLYEAVDGIERFLIGNHVPLSFVELFEQCGAGIKDLIRHVMLPPNRPSGEIYVERLKQRADLKAAVRQYFERHSIEALAFPAVAAVAPLIGQEGELEINGQMVSFFEALGRNTALSPATGIPGLVLPGGCAAGSGLPVGIEFVSLWGEDRRLLSLGHAVEAQLGPIQRPPGTTGVRTP
ncbi:amidase family protein [Paraburkholderia sp. J12]|uniref:amidase family protein n=1 Tax=Paraburkholderia sp. J12 TaxID=2805432 RepID=UPI002ABDED8B|nr:amidase family protein [Paraburkholderia sp. J12]